METVNQPTKFTYKITQTIAVNEQLLRKLNQYFKIHESKKGINIFFSDINSFFPKMVKIFAEYELQKKKIKELENENSDFQDLASEDFNEKERLQNELTQILTNNEKREQKNLEKEEFIEKQFEKTKEQQAVFEKYSRIYLSLAIPIRFAILEYFHTTKNNLASQMVYKYLLKNLEVMKLYPKLSKVVVGNHLKKLADLGFINRIQQGLYSVTQKGSSYFLESCVEDEDDIEEDYAENEGKN